MIHTFNPAIMEHFQFSGASTVGRGGMEAKVASAWDAAQAGVTTVIANGKEPNVLLRVRLLIRTPLPCSEGKGSIYLCFCAAGLISLSWALPTMSMYLEAVWVFQRVPRLIASETFATLRELSGFPYTNLHIELRVAARNASMCSVFG